MRRASRGSTSPDRTAAIVIDGMAWGGFDALPHPARVLGGDRVVGRATRVGAS
ncbi:hypothetical protein A7982_12367 [Minicystis rosea]|nr:hypothetical protein A7982_12367 [Minicystis rosea]